MIFYTNWFIPRGFAAATWCSPFIFIRPSKRDDIGLLMHEKVHVEQFWRNPLMGLWYVFSKKARFAYEVEAYRMQMRMNPENVALYANMLSTKYRLNVTFTEALNALTT